MSKTPHALAQFKFQPQKIQVGEVYHYTKSNLDGTYPARVYIRTMDAENLEVWKFEAHNQDTVCVTAHMDWVSFSADRIESHWVGRDGRREAQARLSSSYAESSFTVQWRGGAETIPIGQYPVHVYNFDFISLNFSLRHWIQPEGEVEIGVVQPNFDQSIPALIRYEGTVTVRYAGEEERNGYSCRKYVVEGAGLQDRSGRMWVDRAAEHVVDMEIPLPDNPAWHSLKFALVSRQNMDEPTWQQFIQTEIGKLKPR